MAYTLPKSRRGSYAIPQYVQDEGLERHAFVTLQVPDGTFDNPKVGNGGYVVPKYVMDDPIGQGVRITKWAPRGTYYGQKIPNWMNQTGNVILREQPAKGGGTAITLKALGDDAVTLSRNVPFQQYGNKVANLLMGHVSKLPAAHRKTELKRLMNAIDPSLWGRAAEISARNMSAGMPAIRALHAGIARAAATGMHAEIIHTGRTRTPPKAQSLMGMGCYGCEAALGALTSTAAGIRAGTPLTAAVAPTAAPTEGVCSADGQYIWHGGGWVRRAAGQACASIDPNQAGPGVIVHTGPAPTVAPTDDMKRIKVGPFMVPYNASGFAIHWTGLLPADWASFINTELAHDCSGCISSSMRNSVPVPGNTIPFGPSNGLPFPNLRQWLGNGLPSQVNSDFISGAMFPDTKVASLANIISGENVTNQNPIVFVQHPDNGDDYGFYIWIDAKDPSKAWNAVTNPWVLTLVWRKVERSWYSDAWNWIAHVVGVVVDAVGDVLGAIADVGCKLVSVAGATTKDPEVAAGAAIGKALCGSPTPPPLPPAPTSSDDWILPVAIGGGTLLAVLAIHHRSRKKR